MASNFYFQFDLTERAKKYIFQNCAVKVLVHSNEGMRCEKFYCLHCERVYAHSSIFVHKDSFYLEPEAVNGIVGLSFSKHHDA